MINFRKTRRIRLVYLYYVIPPQAALTTGSRYFLLAPFVGITGGCLTRCLVVSKTTLKFTLKSREQKYL